MMESKAKLFGHPIHPMLIVLPLGLFLTAVIFDIIYLINGNTTFPTISYFNIAAGIIGGLVAALFGARDWLAIPAGTRAKNIGAMHGLGNVLVVLLFALSWFLRRGDPNHLPSTFALVCSFAGILLGSVTGWLGGELVDRLGVGVDQGANLDAPSSLSHEPARMGSMASVPVTGARDHISGSAELGDEDVEQRR